MRHNNRRMKGRNQNGSNGPRRGNNVPPRMQVFDSNGPDVRIRGTAWQVHEKYLALAKDAAASGDSIMAENYMQHAEHYQRIINTFADQMGGNWTPQQAQAAQAGDDADMDGNAIDAAIPQPQQQAAPRAERREDTRRDDLGLPSSLFGKPAAAPAALESA
ncbi:MAG: DUF4167 domain-containing protein [Rhodospirillales bacterium]|nr:DUF4167 domain-containing protein [Alphaproteobacteria bacterium]MCB9987517.1 DUF4167 domain-containing protein [Rhodospirillales bacterium]USO07509.1 MAG: DUF4167 domain-containing protein [Rhodospirillales bacterium]